MSHHISTEDLRAFLRQRGVVFEERPVQHATQFRCKSGEVFTLYESGKLVPGRQTELTAEIVAWHRGDGDLPAAEQGSAVRRPVGIDRRVFVVYGHDLAARDGLELLLRRMKLEPIVLAKLPAGGDTIIEKLERYIGPEGKIGFACVLLTPDDQGFAVGHPEDNRYRARQNVILELGMVLARLGRSRVAILHKASIDLPSDIAGLLYIPFAERVEEARTQLFHELQNAGLGPDPAGL